MATSLQPHFGVAKDDSGEGEIALWAEFAAVYMVVHFV